MNFLHQHARLQPVAMTAGRHDGRLGVHFRHEKRSADNALIAHSRDFDDAPFSIT